MSGSQKDGSQHTNVGHVVSVRVLVTVLGVLLVLTFLTVAVTWADFGRLNVAIALLIAVVKGSLVLLYFMHLRWDRPFNALVLISSLVFVVLFIGLSLMDVAQYQAETIPGYAPQMQP